MIIVSVCKTTVGCAITVGTTKTVAPTVFTWDGKDAYPYAFLAVTYTFISALKAKLNGDA